VIRRATADFPRVAFLPVRIVSGQDAIVPAMPGDFLIRQGRRDDFEFQLGVSAVELLTAETRRRSDSPVEL